MISTGAQYNKPHLANLEKFEGQGIYYGATYIESQLCEDEEVIVVGGGNSAGQAAVYPVPERTHKCISLVRCGELSETMSRYLIQRITEILQSKCITGQRSLPSRATHLERITWMDRTTG